MLARLALREYGAAVDWLRRALLSGHWKDKAVSCSCAVPETLSDVDVLNLHRTALIELHPWYIGPDNSCCPSSTLKRLPRHDGHLQNKGPRQPVPGMSFNCVRPVPF